MILPFRTNAVRAMTCVFCACLAGPVLADEDEDLDAIRAQLHELVRQNQTMQETIQGLEREVDVARDEARAAQDTARAASVPAPENSEGSTLISSGAVGGAQLQLLDVSLDVLSAFGGSTAQDSELRDLQAGGHDPRQRGFNLQAVELSFQGAVDPYMTGEAHLVYSLDPEGESNFEIEEAFLTSSQLPWGLSEKGFQLEFGQFLTEFGIANPQHAHAWAWQDQPVILSRLFGSDGMRSPGVRVGWLAPLPWYSELHLGTQNAKGENMVSFLASDEVFDEHPIGGRPFAGRDVSGAGDLVYLARWVNGFDISESTSAQLGLSGLLGPNATGTSARTMIAGTDLKVKWRPIESDRGWPFITFQTEFLYRHYEADDFAGCTSEDGCDFTRLAGDTLKDWGFYAQLLYGFRRNWSTGVRYEYATGSGNSLGDAGGRQDDPFRADRQRVSPLVTFSPSEFSRFRLQYNYDRAEQLDDPNVHSVWGGVEFLIGSHPAHAY